MRKNKSQAQRCHSSPFLWSNGLLSLGLSLSGGVAGWLLFTYSDELFSRKEMVFSALLALGMFLISLLVLSFDSREKPHRALPYLFAIVVTAVLLLPARAGWSPSLTNIKDFEIAIEKKTPETEETLVWAWWGKPPLGDSRKPEDFTHVQDISLTQFEQIGNWDLEDGALITQDENARLKFRATGIHQHVPMISLLAKGENALVSIRYNGEVRQLEVSGTDQDGLIIAPMEVSRLADMIIRWIWVFAFTPFLFIPLYFLMNQFPQWAARKSIKARYALALMFAFFVPVAFMLTLYLIFRAYPFGDVVFLRVDFKQHHHVFLAWLHNCILTGNSLFYSLSKGPGEGMIFLLSHHVGSPLNLIMTLFDEETMPLVFNFMVLLRVGLSGLTANLFLQEHKRGTFASVIFSTAYALTQFAFVCTENYFFIDGLIMLPLVALGVHRLVLRKKPFFYTFALAVALFVNFYIAYMLCAFSVLYCVFLLFRNEPKMSGTEQKTTVFRFALHSLIAGGLVAILLLPAFFQMREGVKDMVIDRIGNRMNFPPETLLQKFFAGAYDVDEYTNLGLPNIYSGTVVTLLTLLFFWNRKISGREKVGTFLIFAVLLLSFTREWLNAFWHGFSFAIWWPYRYAFIFSFWMIRTAWLCYLHREGIPSAAYRVAVVVVIGGMLLVEKQEHHLLTQGKIDLEIALALLTLFALWQSNQSDAQEKHIIPCFLMGINMIGLLITGFSVLSINFFDQAINYPDFLNDVHHVEEVLTPLRPTSNDLYRIENESKRLINDAMLFDYPSISHYSSTYTRFASESMRQIGAYVAHYFTTYHAGMPMASDSLMGIRYLLSKHTDFDKPYPRVVEAEDLSAHENPYALPLTMVVPREFLQTPTMGKNPFINLNQLFRGLAHEDFGDIFTPETFAETNPAPAKGMVVAGTVHRIEPLYAYFYQAEYYPSSLLINGEESIDKIDRSLISNAMNHLGSFSAGDRIEMVYSEIINIPEKDAPLFYYENRDVLAKYVENIRQGAATLRKTDDAHLFVTVETEQPSLLALTLLWDAGWSAAVNGAPQRIIHAANNFMAIPIEPGTSEIALRYTPAGLKTGAGISFMSWIAIAALWMSQKKQRGRVKLS